MRLRARHFSPPCAEAKALFNARTVQPTISYRRYESSGIRRLGAVGTKAKLDVLYCFWAGTQQASLLNIINTATFLPTVSGSVTYTAPGAGLAAGIAGNGTDSYIDSGYNPVDHASLDDHHQGGVVMTESQLSNLTGADWGNSNSRANVRNTGAAGGLNARINSAGSALSGIFSSIAHVVVNRVVANEFTVTRSAELLSTEPVSSSSMTNLNYLIGASNDTLTKLFSPRSIGGWHTGSGFNDTDQREIFHFYKWVGLGAGVVPADFKADTTDLYYRVTPSAKELSVTWVHDDDTMLRLSCDAVTANTLPTFNKLEVAPIGNPLFAPYALKNETETDWMPPIAFAAVANGDDSDLHFTGGNHVDTETDDPTAQLTAWAFTADGVAKASPAAGTCATGQLTYTAEIEAFNTHADRYVLDETIVLNFHQGSVAVHVTDNPREDIKRYWSNGLQTQSDGYRDAIHFWGGQQGAQFVPETNTSYESGDGLHTSRVIAAKDNTHGWQISWLDSTYGSGADYATLIKADFSEMRDEPTGAVPNHKTYQTLARQDTDVTAEAIGSAETRVYRGAYAWSPLSMATGTIEAAFRHVVGSDVFYKAIVTSAGSGRIIPRANDVPDMPVDGLVIGNSGYGMVNYEK